MQVRPPAPSRLGLVLKLKIYYFKKYAYARIINMPKKDKKGFILDFIKGVVNAAKEVHEVYNWTPIYYKGFHVSGPKGKKIYQGFSNLKQRGVIKEAGKDKYEFTEKGRTWFRGVLIKHYVNLGVKWDGKWRILIFDIPQELHNKRNRLRTKLKFLGFYMLQKSVFTFPYPCEDELVGYCNNLNISDYVNIITAENLGHIESDVREFFKLE